jgi:uncharacterized RDD family membrane protein YckC
VTEQAEARLGPRARFGQRFLAFLIDVVLLGFVNGVLRHRVGVSYGVTPNAPSFLDLLPIAYWIAFEGSPSGQTVGKRIIGIRIVDFDTGGPIGYGRAAIRYVARAVSLAVVLLGCLWMLWDRQSQTWHDKLVNSVVVPVDVYPVVSWPGWAQAR